MTKKNQMSAIVRRLALTLTVVALVSATGCAGKKTTEEESTVPTSMGADENLSGDSDSGKAMGLQTVTFPYDSFSLDQSGKDTLKSNAEILKANSSVKVQVEGHCDQRGGIQYNIALGEKRANATKKFLADLGITGDRVSTISFGKERPVDPSMTEEAYSKNRRANFVITSK